MAGQLEGRELGGAESIELSCKLGHIHITMFLPPHTRVRSAGCTAAAAALLARPHSGLLRGARFT